MTLHYDVVVIGGGPAGASTAYHLASRGVRVLVVDRAHFPRDKACGDMVSQFALDQLHEIGLSDLVAAHTPKPLWQANFGAPSGWEMKHSVKTRSLWATIPRLILDDAVLSQARQAGAEVLERVTVSGIHVDAKGVQLRAQGIQDNTIEARLVVVAVGSSGALVPTQPSLFALRGYFSRLAGEADLILKWNRDLTPGYLWQFLIDETKTNIGIYTTRAQAQAMKINERLLSSSIVKGKELIGALRGGLVNTSFRRKSIAHGDRLLYVGDAAGLVQPHLGEGIAPALQSGKLAAEIGKKALENDRLTAHNLALYTRRLHHTLDNQIAISRFLFCTMRHPRLFELIARPAALTHSELFRLLALISPSHAPRSPQ